MTRILRMAEIEEYLTIQDCLDVLETTFAALQTGGAMTDARVDVLTPASDPPAEAEPPVYHGLKSMSGSIPELGVAAVRTNSDIVHWKTHGVTGKRVKEKIPAADGRYSAPVLLFSTDTGEPLMIFPDGLVQSYRVGATSALGAKYLAREDASVLGMLGSGQQARHHLLALAAVRDLRRVTVYSPTPRSREAFTDEMRAETGIDVRAAAKPRDVVDGADIVQAATNSLSPVFDMDWVEPGTHVGIIRYLEAPDAFFDPAAFEVLGQAWPETRRIEQVGTEVNAFDYETWTMSTYVSAGEELPPRLARVGSAAEPLCDWSLVPGLGELIVEDDVGRTSPDDRTGFYNAGLGVQFAAVGKVLYDLAETLDLGIDLETDVFTQEYHP